MVFSRIRGVGRSRPILPRGRGGGRWMVGPGRDRDREGIIRCRPRRRSRSIVRGTRKYLGRLGRAARVRVKVRAIKLRAVVRRSLPPPHTHELPPHLRLRTLERRLLPAPLRLVLLFAVPPLHLTKLTRDIAPASPSLKSNTSTAASLLRLLPLLLPKAEDHTPACG